MTIVFVSSFFCSFIKPFAFYGYNVSSDCLLFCSVVYFPASGRRFSDTGGLTEIGQGVRSCSSSSRSRGVCNSTSLNASVSMVNLMHPDTYRASSFPVRCVQVFI